MAHIEAFQMINIQSWGDQSEAISLSDKSLNVIIGDNETGKSVLFKIFRQMCFPNFFGRNGRETLIRENCQSGTLLLKLDTKEVVRFDMFKTRQVYSYFNSEGDLTKWEQNELPEPIRELLGWYIDTEFNILLNLIDLEVPLPLLESSDKFNARILKFVVEHPELNKSIETYNEWLVDLTSAIKVNDSDLFNVKKQSEAVPLRDPAPIELRINKTRKIIDAYENLNPIHESTLALSKVKVPNGFKEIPNIEAIMNARSTLTDIVEHLTLPEPSEFTPIEAIDTIVRASETLSGMIDILGLPTPTPLPFIDIIKLKSAMGSLDTLTRLQRSLTIYINKASEYNSHIQDLEEIESTLALLKPQLKSCPECGQALDHTHNNAKVGEKLW